MAKFPFKQVTIVGVGLLGGSMGLAIKRLRRDAVVIGVGRRESSLNRAIKVGAIDRAYLDVTQAMVGSDLIVLATPVCAFAGYLRKIAPLLKAGAIVTDVGSTKQIVVAQAEKILGKRRGAAFVGSHPMAGSEQRGPEAAKVDLLQGATCVITPTKNTPPTAVKKIQDMWQMLGMKTVRLSPTAHDQAVANISHLPHLLSATLMQLPTDGDLTLVAGGFRDMTRIAAGDVEMWRDILLTNRKPILRAIEKYTKSLTKAKKLIATAKTKQIENFLTAARERRSKKFR